MAGKIVALLLLALASVSAQTSAAEVPARSDAEMEQRANAKFRLRVTIAAPRQECAAFQAELARSMMADGVSKAEVEREIDRILADPGEMMNRIRATQAKPYAQQYREYYDCTYRTDYLTNIGIGQDSLKTKRTTAPGAPTIGPGEYLRVGPREFLFLPDEDRRAYYAYRGEISPRNEPPSKGNRPTAGLASPPPASAPQARSSERIEASRSATQAVSCADEIKRVQIESQSWSGNADDVAARLGRFQKDLFEGRCSGHPEAQAYINGANKMLSYGGNPAGSGGGTTATGTATATTPLAPIRRDTQSKEHNPAHNASTCIKVYGPQEIKARGLHTTANSLLVNTCPYAVSVLWCVEAGNGHAGDCGRGYSNTWDLSAAGKQGSMWGIPADGQMVQFAACRHGPNMGFQSVEEDPRHPYRFSCS